MRTCKDDGMNINESSLIVARIQQSGDPAIHLGWQRDARTLQLPVARRIVTSRICICCGESMVKRGNALSPNPNVCGSCSSLADGMEVENETNVSHEILP